MARRLYLLILSVSFGLTGCTTSTDFPYNPNSVKYYASEPLEEQLIVIPVRPYYRYDHQNHFYYHTTPIKP